MMESYIIIITGLITAAGAVVWVHLKNVQWWVENHHKRLDRLEDTVIKHGEDIVRCSGGVKNDT